MDEQDLHDAMATGARADATLTTFNAAFTTLRESYVKAWAGSELRDAAGRERLWQAVQIIDKVQTQLRTLRDGGTIAQKQLNDIRTLGPQGIAARLRGLVAV